MANNEIEKILEFGIINVDKPIGPTSHKTTEYVKHILRVRKAGHSGTLDPAVSGVLPIGLNKATRILEVLLQLPKEYVGVMRLHDDIGIQQIRKVVKRNFLGKIKQLPPKKSAVVRKERVREVYEFKILEKQDRDVLFRVKGQAGLYVRKLIHDLGISLEVGAHMLELRRIAVGHFTESSTVTLYELTKAYDEAMCRKLSKLKKFVLPIDLAVSHLPKIHLNEIGMRKFKLGQFIFKSEIEKADKFTKNELCAAFFENRFVALCRPFYSSTELKKVKAEQYALRPEKIFV